MDVLGEPVVGQLGADALRARLLEDVGAGSGELQAGADVVHETGDLPVALPAQRAPGEHVRKIGKLVHAHGSVVPPAAGALRLHVRRALHHVVVVLRLPAVAEDHAVAAAEHLAVDLLRLDAAHVYAGPEPARLDHAHHRGGRRGDDVGALDARYGAVDRNDLRFVDFLRL